MWNLLRAISYECQPIRSSDAILLWNYFNKACNQISVALQDFSFEFYKGIILSIIGKFGPRQIRWASLFACGLAVFTYLDFASLYCMICLTLFIIYNGFEERREGELSSYNIFNAGFQKLLGTTTAEQFDGEIRAVDPAIAQGNQLHDLAAGVNDIAEMLRLQEMDDQAERNRQAEAMKREVAENPYRKRKGKKARRDNEKVATKVLERRAGADDDADDDDAAFGEGGDWEEDWNDD